MDEQNPPLPPPIPFDLKHRNRARFPPVVQRAIEQLRDLAPEKANLFVDSEVDISDWEPNNWGGLRVLGGSVRKDPEAHKLQGPYLGPTMVGLNPMFVALGSDKQITDTVAHEAEHLNQFRTQDQDIMTYQRLMPYESRPIEIKAAKAGKETAKGMSDYVLSPMLQSLANLFKR